MFGIRDNGYNKNKNINSDDKIQFCWRHIMGLSSLIDREVLKSALLEQLTAGNGNDGSTATFTSQKPQKSGSTMASKSSNNANLGALEKMVETRFEAIERRMTFLENMIVAMSSGD